MSELDERSQSMYIERDEKGESEASQLRKRRRGVQREKKRLLLSPLKARARRVRVITDSLSRVSSID